MIWVCNTQSQLLVTIIALNGEAVTPEGWDCFAVIWTATSTWTYFAYLILCFEKSYCEITAISIDH